MKTWHVEITLQIMCLCEWGNNANKQVPELQTNKQTDKQTGQLTRENSRSNKADMKRQVALYLEVYKLTYYNISTSQQTIDTRASFPNITYIHRAILLHCDANMYLC